MKHLTFLLNHHCTKIYTLFSRFEFFFLLAINKFIFQSLACVSVNKSTFISSARMVYPLLLICNSCLIARERVNRRISENTEKKAPATVECAPSCLFVPIYHQFSSDNLQDLLFALFFLIQMNHNNMNSSTPNQSPWIIWLFRFFFLFPNCEQCTKSIILASMPPMRHTEIDCKNWNSRQNNNRVIHKTIQNSHIVIHTNVNEVKKVFDFYRISFLLFFTLEIPLELFEFIIIVTMNSLNNFWFFSEIFSALILDLKLSSRKGRFDGNIDVCMATKSQWLLAKARSNRLNTGHAIYLRIQWTKKWSTNRIDIRLNSKTKATLSACMYFAIQSGSGKAFPTIATHETITAQNSIWKKPISKISEPIPALFELSSYHLPVLNLETTPTWVRRDLIDGWDYLIKTSDKWMREKQARNESQSTQRVTKVSDTVYQLSLVHLTHQS